MNTEQLQEFVEETAGQEFLTQELLVKTVTYLVRSGYTKDQTLAICHWIKKLWSANISRAWVFGLLNPIKFEPEKEAP